MQVVPNPAQPATTFEDQALNNNGSGVAIAATISGLSATGDRRASVTDTQPTGDRENFYPINHVVAAADVEA